MGLFIKYLAFEMLPKLRLHRDSTKLYIFISGTVKLDEDRFVAVTQQFSLGTHVHDPKPESSPSLARSLWGDAGH